MNQYIIYWMREDIAYHFFHKNDVLYRFLIAYQYNKYNQDLTTQFNYIAKQFPKHDLISHIKKCSHEFKIDFQIKKEIVELHKDNNLATLNFLDDKQIKLYCETIHCAELLVFPIFRLFHPYFFIVNANHHQYGWLSPFVKSEQINKDEVLYSLR